MKKYFIFVLLFSLKAAAWEVTFHRKNHMGARKIDIFKEEAGVFIFDGKVLGKTLPPAVLATWKKLQEGPPKDSTTLCASGRYTFEKKEKGKSVKRQGCTEGEAYGQFIQDIEDIRTFAKGL